MKKLPPNFKPVFDTIKPLMSVDINNSSYFTLNNIYKKINNTMRENKCESYDLNNILANYPKKSEEHSRFVNKLRNFVTKKNRGVARRIFKSSKWIDFLKKTRNDVNKQFINKVSLSEIKDGMSLILGKYSKNWDGFWSVAELNNNGDIKKVDIVDINDMDLLLVYLAKKHEWKIKNNDLKKKLKNL